MCFSSAQLRHLLGRKLLLQRLQTAGASRLSAKALQRLARATSWQQGAVCRCTVSYAPALHTMLHCRASVLLFLQAKRQSSRNLQRTSCRGQKTGCVPLQKGALAYNSAQTKQ